MKAPRRPVGLMTLAQGICAAVMVLTLMLLVYVPCEQLLYILVGFSEASATTIVLHTLCTLGRLALWACLFTIEIEAFMLCDRVRRNSSFTAKNAKALGRIVRALVVAGVLLLYFGQFVMDYLLCGLPEVVPVIRVGLPSFAVLTLALMIRAVQVLMRRALTMQEESDLTV